ADHVSHGWFGGCGDREIATFGTGKLADTIGFIGGHLSAGGYGWPKQGGTAGYRAINLSRIRTAMLCRTFPNFAANFSIQ
ncbi:MAG TPA: hypothetical protein PKN15_12095, partial [Chitinophagales bacterium]|nr:hypothetical protein [Chitinophagales bacterium]